MTARIEPQIPRWIVMWLGGIIISGIGVALGSVASYTTTVVTQANIRSNLSAREQEITRLEAAGHNIDARLRSIEADVAAMREIVNVQGVIAFERRMTSLEARTATTEFRLERINAPR